jgi:xylitol oxidase
LPNLAGLAEISVGGAIQTGTHGSSWYTGNLATQVRSVQLVLANGTVANFGPGQEEMKALALGLGAFGVLTQVELNLVPRFDLTNYVFLK